MTEPEDRDRRPDRAPAPDDPVSEQAASSETSGARTEQPGTDSGFADLSWEDIDLRDTDWHSADWAEEPEDARRQPSAEPAEQAEPAQESAQEPAQPVPEPTAGQAEVSQPRTPDAEIKPEGEGAAPDRGVQPDAVGAPETTRQRLINQVTSLHRPKWTTVGFLALAAVLVFGFVHAVTGGGLSTNSGSGAPPPPPPTVLVNGVPVPVNGPMLSLDPGLVRQGSHVGVSGSGFDPGSSVDIAFVPAGKGPPQQVGTALVSREGVVNSGFTAPPMAGTNHGVVIAREQGSNKVAQADAVVPAAQAGTVAIDKASGRPGDVVTASGGGFQPGEKIAAYWGGIDGTPSAQIPADPRGGFAHAPVRVGIGRSGSNTLVMIGERSRTTATTSFWMQALYPSVTVSPYAAKAAQQVAVSGSGFVPGERVLVYLNRAAGPPAAVLPGSPTGTVSGARFLLPYQLSGTQNITLVGERSRATAKSGFMIMPYTPSAQPSTWSGMPGTKLSFYVTDFAPNEVVLVYANSAPGRNGDLVSAFRVNAQGAAKAAGSWQIPSNAQGKTNVRLVGRQSGGTATINLTVQAGGGADFPAPPPYVLPPELAADPVVPGGPPPPPPAPPAPPPRPGAPAPPPTR